MHVMMGWFSRQALPSSGPDEAALFGGPAARVAQVLGKIVPDSYVRHDFGGADWGLAVCEIGERDGWRWPVVASKGSVSAISLGIPLGLAVETGAVDLARRQLSGEDVLAAVAPPFGLTAVDGDRRVVVKQDWLGMCRIFTGEQDDIVYVATRPGLIADLLGRTPDRAGWSSYVACGHFGGE